MQLDAGPDRPWGKDERVNKLVFIGRDLDAERDRLMDAAAYRAWLAPRMDRFQPPVATPDDVYDPTRWL